MPYGFCIYFFSDLCFDMSLLLLNVTLRGVSNKHCLLSLFSFLRAKNKADLFSVMNLFTSSINI